MSTKRRATYRVQLHPGFTLDDAAAIAGYLADLGISHLYCSPYLQAAPGSSHGYDVVNHHQVNEELGGGDALAHLNNTLKEQGLGQVLDIVPNHMAISGPENPWWWDVLTHGPSSRYASYFDVEWDPPETRHSNVVLVPVLADQYGRVLEAGELRLAYEKGAFVIRYYDNVYPVNPRSLDTMLAVAAERTHSDTLAFIAGAFGRLPESLATDRASARRRYRDQSVLYALLNRLMAEQPAVATAVRQAVEAINDDPDALDALLQYQNYRLAFWRISQCELGYRRFFDINTLIGLSMEDEQVYRDTHALVLDWLAEGRLDGLRIDHPDGLRDPEEYFRRLNQARPETWIVVEKILEEDERLLPSWPVAGTTGYDFLNRVNGLFVDAGSEQVLSDFYAAFTGETTDYAALVREKKRLVMDEVLGSDVNYLTELLLQVCERHRRYRDYTRNVLREMLGEVAVCLPVYRTYVRPEAGEVHDHDVRYLAEAIAAAKANRPDIDDGLFDFFGDLMLLRVRGEVEAELVLRFQQFTGPVMAKGVEDTTFYCYNRFVSLNEVGGNPGRFGLAVEAFHQACVETLARRPQSMLATSTHDTKRSEDVRARLNVLSEMPEAWTEAVRRWSSGNERYRQGEWPARNDEYLFYQTVVGAWPIDVERVLLFMEKAVREAKMYSSWRSPDEAYESAVANFVRGTLADEEFTADLQRFVARVVEPGRVNALAQTLLKLTTPGIPDLYQGSELWNLSLVDPDNRRPVDYEQRRRLLAFLESKPAPEEIWARADEGLPKLWLIRQALAFRSRRPALFGPDSSYRPLPVKGMGHAVAFARGEGDGDAGAIVVVPRLTVRLAGKGNVATVQLPAGEWRNELTRERVAGGEAPVAKLLARFPVCLLSRES